MMDGYSKFYQRMLFYVLLIICFLAICAIFGMCAEVVSAYARTLDIIAIL